MHLWYQKVSYDEWHFPSFWSYWSAYIYPCRLVFLCQTNFTQQFRYQFKATVSGFSGGKKGISVALISSLFDELVSCGSFLAGILKETSRDCFFFFFFFFGGGGGRFSDLHWLTFRSWTIPFNFLQTKRNAMFVINSQKSPLTVSLPTSIWTPVTSWRPLRRSWSARWNKRHIFRKYSRQVDISLRNWVWNETVDTEKCSAEALNTQTKQTQEGLKWFGERCFARCCTFTEDVGFSCTQRGKEPSRMHVPALWLAS